jgi:hypothetical protein
LLQCLLLMMISVEVAMLLLLLLLANSHDYIACCCCCCCSVWEVAMASVPWAGQMMGGIMHSVMLQGQRLQFAPGVPKVSRAVARDCSSNVFDYVELCCTEACTWHLDVSPHHVSVNV